MEKLQGVKDLLVYENDEKFVMVEELVEVVVFLVLIDSLVVGVLEEVFFEMVSLQCILYNLYVMLVMFF